MSVITIYRKKDNKKCSCDIAQVDIMTKGKDAQYSIEPVEVKEPLKSTSK